jgi:hypothetical protein
MIIFGGLVALLLIVRPRRSARRGGGAQDRPRLAARFLVGAVGPETEGKQRRSDWRTAVRSATYAMTTLAMLALCGLEGAHAQVRAKADVSCRPAEKLQYDCIIARQFPHQRAFVRPHPDGGSGHALDAGGA